MTDDDNAANQPAGPIRYRKERGCDAPPIHRARPALDTSTSCSTGAIALLRNTGCVGACTGETTAQVNATTGPSQLRPPNAGCRYSPSL